MRCTFCVQVIPSLNPSPSLSHSLGSCLYMLLGEIWQPSVELALIFGARVGALGPKLVMSEYSRVGLTIVVYAVTFTCLLQSPRLWQINPRVLFALLVVMSTCFCQLRSSLNVTPRYLLLSVVCRTWLCTVQGVCDVDYTFLCGMLSDHSTLFQMERHLPFSFPFLKSC